MDNWMSIESVSLQFLVRSEIKHTIHKAMALN